MTSWDKQFFIENRRRLASRIEGGVMALAGYVSVQRSNDMAQPFTQDANFWYLTGITEPGWQMVYDGTRHRCWLIRPEIDETTRLFDGSLSDEQAIAISGADEVIARRDQETVLRQLARRHATVYGIDPKSLHAHASFVVNPAAGELYAVLERIFSHISDVQTPLAVLRSIKSDEEVAAIKRAVTLTTKTFETVKQSLSAYHHEYEIEAAFGYAFRKTGAQFAYDPIVASGANACTLHYIANRDRRPKQGAVLIDIGAQAAGYCADITRTYAWQSPTKRTIRLHQALEAAHHQIIKSIQPDMPVMEYQRAVDEIMQNMMVEQGLLSAGDDPRYRQYFPHAISHGLGIDVHDSLGGTRTLQPGMVLTVEPGLYLADEGIGMRIEDDVVVTKSGVVNLSASLSTSLE